MPRFIQFPTAVQQNGIRSGVHVFAANAVVTRQNAKERVLKCMMSSKVMDYGTSDSILVESDGWN